MNFGNRENKEPKRTRKLLLHKKEIEKIMEEYNQPFYFAEQMYLSDNNMYKNGYNYCKRRNKRAKCVKDLF